MRRRGLRTLSVAVGTTISLVASALPAHAAVDGSRYLQVITSSAGCHNRIDVSRYSSTGRLVGSRTIVRTVKNLQLVPLAYDWTYGQKAQPFLYEVYNCASSQTSLYALSLASKTALPKLVYRTSGGEMLWGATIDLATKRVLLLLSDGLMGSRVDSVSLSGRGRSTIWHSSDGPAVDVRFTKIVSKTGQEVLLAGDTGHSEGHWSAIRLRHYNGAWDGSLDRTGPGRLTSMATGAIGLDEATTFVSDKGNAWLCKDGSGSTSVAACLHFAAPTGFLGESARPAFVWGGAAPAIAWVDCGGGLCVQGADTALDGRPTLGRLRHILAGPAAYGIYVLAATNFGTAVDLTAPTVTAG